jgi:UDP-N-acetylglucosamine--N-acetylmuramyl-(pentapeptide) pyrophosphoryl-undecaprenol N-acetylglucosamine transferase
MDNTQKTIIFSGGGTGGSVTPLLAVAAELLKERSDLNLFFVGSENGPEKELVANFENKKIKFLTIPSGKWRRYFSANNYFDLFKIIGAWFVSLKILHKAKPELVISAGSFVSVPLVWAAACLRIPILIHQQDIRPGFANKLMAPFARVVTITFEKSFIDYGPRAVLTGNPLKDISAYQTKRIETRNRYGFKIDEPLVLVVGGGTGSLAINNLVVKALPNLLSICQVVHVTGYGKKVETDIKSKDYQVFEFLNQTEILSLMATADLVISRCGLGALTELASLAKPVILIPIPNSHQEENAAVFEERDACLLLNQNSLNSEILFTEVKKILADDKLRGRLSNNISKIMKPDAARNIAAIIFEIVKIK